MFYTKKSGTSMSTPIVSGAIALLLSKYPNMTNRDVKLKIFNSSDDIGLDKNQQGWGMLNIEKLLR
jgi:serine protease AprX